MLHRLYTTSGHKTVGGAGGQRSHRLEGVELDVVIILVTGNAIIWTGNKVTRSREGDDEASIVRANSLESGFLHNYLRRAVQLQGLATMQ